ncbi:MAG: tyrosine-protein phosphatase, partial [Desulfuromonadales bacterium]
MIDYHCHLLPGFDDGPASVDETVDMARALAAFGFREVCCTPHCIKGQYEFSPVEVRDAVRSLQARLDLERIALRLHAGMEYYLDECFAQFAANLLPLGESRVVLCEAPPLAPPGLVADMAGLIVVQGYIPLIAHPERSDVVWQMIENQGLETGGSSRKDDNQGLETGGVGLAPDNIKPFWKRLFAFASPQPPVPGPRSSAPPADDSSLIAQDSAFESSGLPDEALFQANLGSFTGYYGPKPQRRAYELLQRGVYHCLASDLHEARSATALLELAREKLAFNPALQKLGTFKAPQGQGGNDQLAF